MPVMKPLEEINTGAELEADALLEIVDDAEAPSDDGYIIDDEGNLVEASDEEEVKPTEFGDNLAFLIRK
jgi:C4-dicarboxylate-specific signal transduction histidine kinase